MELQFFGANRFRVSTKDATIVTDDKPSEHDGKTIIKKGDIGIFTGVHEGKHEDVKMIIGQPGEYEVAGVSITGIAARAHMDEEGGMSATMYKVISKDVRILVTGHIYPDLSEEQLEQIGVVDILLIPVGGNGYTLDGVGALKVIKKVEPKIIVPAHYSDSSVKYPVPQQSLTKAVEQLGMEVSEKTDKLKIKNTGDIGEVTRLVVIESK